MASSTTMGRVKETKSDIQQDNDNTNGVADEEIEEDVSSCSHSLYPLETSNSPALTPSYSNILIICY